MPQNSSKPLIEICNGAVRYHDRILFKGLNLKLCSGQHWAIVGNSCIGKSLLVDVLTGQVPLLQGELLFNSNEMFTDILDHTGYVDLSDNRKMKKQENLFVQARYWSLGESSTVREFLSERNVKNVNPFEVLKVPVDGSSYKRLQRKIISMLQIEELLDKEVHTLSNGESRKVLLARELLKKPLILILNNPYYGLDKDYVLYLNNHIFPLLIKQGLLIICLFVDKNQIPGCATNFLAINNFKIEQHGSLQNKINEKECPENIPSESKLSMVLKECFYNRKKACNRSAGEIVKINNASIRYGNNTILDNVSWTVRERENWAILGANGSGKTTLLSLILGDNPQVYSNDISIFGTKWGVGSSIWTIKKKTGWVSPELQICYPLDEMCFNVVLSGFFDTIGLYSRVTVPQRTLVKKMFKVFCLQNESCLRFGTVSEGVQRLVLLMRSLVKGPRLLILDEPLYGLAEKFRKQIISVLNTLSAQFPITILYVTHQLDEIPSCITNVLKLERGAIKKSYKI